MHDQRSIKCSEHGQKSCLMFSKMHKRRNFPREACIISVMAAFVIGLSLGIFVPVIGLGTAISSESNDRQLLLLRSPTNFEQNDKTSNHIGTSSNHLSTELQFPIIYKVQNEQNKALREDLYAVTFVNEENMLKTHVSDTNDMDSITDTDIEPNGHLFANSFYNKDKQQQKQQQQQPSQRRISFERLADGKHAHATKLSFLSNSIKRMNKNNSKKFFQIEFPTEERMIDGYHDKESVEKVLPAAKPIKGDDNPFDVIDDNIFWGKIIEDSLPNGFTPQHVNDWNAYVNQSVIVKLEIGCGRMQNRLVTFKDGRQACARYRQNTDQIQGELFSFYLGQLLNLSNLAPSTASIIDLHSPLWLNATRDLQSAQWKMQRPVVLTDWIPKLEAANIPTVFQPIERHLNRFDVKNITLGLDAPKTSKSLLHHLGGIKSNPNWNQLPIVKHAENAEMNKTVREKLLELAQWSDLIIFDYLIANLDRVVNNLYNFQWNADIMTAPAHNLARKSDSQLLVFLDNESGLLHGYRLLKKYETYHGLLLGNLCVFRRPTIEALQKLQKDGIGGRLQQLFEQSTSKKVRDVLPSLPDKSIKILVDRISTVLGQVDKCRELFSKR